MADQKKQDSQINTDDRLSSSDQGKRQSSDPGRTPGSAEGDRRTVEDDLRNQSGNRQSS
ncbi:MAG: hypothetical protein ACJ74G_10850 [Blastocatellia bacterium]